MSNKHYTIKIYGKVHGVTFRWSARRKASSLKINGSVRNEPDGSVLIEAEGDERDLEKFVSWCRSGPLFAAVERLEVDEGEIKGYNIFEIK